MFDESEEEVDGEEEAEEEEEEGEGWEEEGASAAGLTVSGAEPVEFG